MKSLKKGIISLLAFMIALTLTPSVFAATGDSDASGSDTKSVYTVKNPDPSSENGLYSSKTLTLNDDGTGTITLETYVTGSIVSTGTPTDVVLVLDVSQSMSQKMGSITKLAALKSAVNTFIDTTAKKNESAKTDAQKSRISIVSFSGSATVVSDFSSDATTLKSAVTNLKQGQGTAADYAMTTAKSQLDKIDSTRKSNKVVIFFTDGEPNHGSGSFNATVANSAISTAKTIKASGATVYSIGVVSGADPSLDPTASSTSNINKFLHGVSSNYPDATAYTSLGTRAKDSAGKDLTCYKSATNASELEKIFDDIGEAAVPSVELNTASIVQDTMSEYVEFNGSVAGDVKVYTSKYTGKDADGNATFAERVAASDTIKTTVKDGTVQVTGFDFEPVIDKTATTYQGKKLIIEIPVKLADGAASMSGEELNSNDAASSGIYQKDSQTPVRSFGTPTATMPKAKITVTANDSEKTYDGTPLTDSSYTVDGTLVEGDVLTAVVEGSRTDAGSSANVVKSYKVMRGDKDVTDKYDISTKDGKLTVNKRAVTFTGESDTITYDRNNHKLTKITAENLVDGHTYKDLTYEASGTNAGTYEGEFTGDVKIMDGDTDVTANYEVTKTPGTLKINPVEDEVVVTIVGEHATQVYSGESYKVTGYTVTNISNSLYKESDCALVNEEAANATRTNVGTSNMELTADSFKNINNNFKNVEFQVTDGYIKVTPKSVTFTGESDEVTYNGEEQSITKITDEGLVDDHTYEGLTYKAAGTDAGDYNGEFDGTLVIKDTDGKDVTENYTVTKTPGKLKINPVEDKVVVTIVGNYATNEYAGKEFTVSGYEVTDISNELYSKDDCGLVGDSKAEAVRTDVGTTKMGITADSFENTNKNFKTVEFRVTDGYIEITKRPVNINIVSSEKLYGKDDPEFDDATMAGQVEGELTDIALAVSRTDAGKEGGEKLGKHEGVLQIADTKEELEDKYTNYTFTITNGDFTIKENGEDLKVKADDVEQVYNGNSITTVATAGLEGATIKYADENGEYTLDTCPTLTDVGEKTVKFQATLEGYTPATGTATLKVTKRPVTITVGDAEKKYSDEDPAFENAAMSGQVDGELKDIDLTVTRTDLEAEDGEELGLHEGVLQIADTKESLEKEYTNYTFTITNGNFTITENDVKLTVSAENVEQVYDGNSITTVATAGIEGATIKYMDDEGNYTLDECPTLTNVGERTVKFQATAHGYKAATGEATLKVTKRPVTITVGDSGKLYGKDDPEFGDAELTNQIGKELDDISLKVTRTDADDEEKGEELGKHEGVLQIADTKEELEEKYTNYTFTIKNGDFTISTNNVDLKVEAPDVTETYSGKAISTTASAGIKGATIKYMDEEGNYTLDECPTLTDVGERTVKFQATLKGYTDATGEAKLEVTPATLKVTTPSDSKVYDGTALTKEGSYEGLAEGETITFETTGTRTNVGDAKNTYEIKWDGSAKKSNYTVVEESIGTLTVTKKPVTITGESQTITYDGEEHTLMKIDAKDLVSGHKLEGLAYKATGTNAGDYDGEFSGTVKIMDGDKDVTDNYDVTKTPGKLTITPISEEVVVTIEGNKETKTYTGSEQSTTGYKITKISNELYKAEDVELVGKAEASRTDVGTTIMNLGKNNFKNTNKNFAKVKFDIWDGSIEITKKAVTFTGESDEVTYNGEEQSITKITDEGLVDGHTYEGLTYKAAGTDAGEYDGGFTGTVKIKDGDEDVTDNYNVTTTPGKLTINPVTDEVVVTIVGEHATQVYSGESYKVTGYTVTDISNSLYKKTDCALVKEDAANATRTDAGTSNMELTADSFKNINDNFKNVEFQVTDGYITVTKRPVTIKVVDASKVYGNPDPEFADATMENQVEGELKDIDLTVSRTDATDNTLGEHKGVLQIKDTKESLEKEYTNYTFTITNGNFTISTNETGLEVSAPPVTETYTGKAISTTASAGIKDATIKYMDEDGKYTLDECPTLTDVGERTVKFQATAYGYKSATGEAKLTVIPATLTVTTPDAEKVYDGEPLTKDGELTGLQNGETVTFETTGTRTNAGKSDNTYEIKWDGTAKKGNYTVTEDIGELEVTKAPISDYVTLTPNNTEQTYNGNPLAAGKATATDKLGKNDLKIEYSVDGEEWTTDPSEITATDVADSKTVQVRVSDAAGDNGNYEGYVTATETITINKATLNVTTPSDSKEYDGTPLTKAGSYKGLVKEETITFKTTGTQTNYGKSDNTYEIKWDGTAKKGNYTVTEDIGELEVTKAPISDYVTLTTKDTDQTYNGDPLAAGKATATDKLDKNDLLIEYSADGKTWTTDPSEITATNVKDSKLKDNPVKVRVSDAAGDNGNYDGYVEGDETITIKPATLKVTTPSDSKEYDGTPLTKEGSYEGLVKEETITFTTTGTQTNYGESDNTYEIKWDGTADENNYAVDETIGKLKVTKAPIGKYVTLDPKNTEQVYNGKPLAAGEATATDSLNANELKIEYSVDGETWTEDFNEITATDVADSKLAENPVYVRVSDAKGDEGNYEGYAEAKETITITKAPIKVVTPSAKKQYDGKPLTKEGELTGLQNGETVTFITTGSQTKVGKSDNTYEIKWDGTAKEGNYTVEAEIGELEVTKAKVTPDTGDDNNVVLYGFMGLTALVAELFVVSRRRRSSEK